MIPYLEPPEIVIRSALEGGDDKPVSGWIAPWDHQEDMDVGIVGVPLAKAGPFYKGVHQAPNAIREAFGLSWPYSCDHHLDLASLKVRDLGNIRIHPTDVLACHSNIEAALTELYQLKPDLLTVIVGGDHSIPLPSVKAFCKARSQRVGLIWIDAHHDMDSAWGGPNSASAARRILEADIGVKGRNFVQLGIHEFANPLSWRRYADEQKVTVLSARQVKERGAESVFREAIKIASDGTDSIYVSLDVDALEQVHIPGHVVPSPFGLSPWDLLEGLEILGRCPMVKAMDLVCIDPSRDVAGMTVRIGCGLILAFITGYYQRVLQQRAEQGNA